jgi:hypothetical protein
VKLGTKNHKRWLWIWATVNFELINDNHLVTASKR